MSIVEMKKLVLIGHKSVKNELLRALHKCGVVEVSKTRLLENTFYAEDGKNGEETAEKLSRLSFCFDFLKEQQRQADKLVKKELFSYEKPKKAMIQPTPRFSYDDFYKIRDKESALWDEVKSIETINSRVQDIKGEILKINAVTEQVKVFADIDVILGGFKDTPHTSMFLGAVPSARAKAVRAITEKYEGLYVYVDEKPAKLSAVAVICLKEIKDDVVSDLNALEFIRSDFTFDKTAAEILADNAAAVAALEEERTALLSDTMKKLGLVDDLKQLYDLYLIEKAFIRAGDGFAQTKSAFVLEGFVPVSEEEKVKGVLDGFADKSVYEISDPEEGDVVPTLVKSGKAVAPFESITNMFSAPAVNDIDPNPFVAFFYTLLFGLMMGDAVYGIFLAVFGFTMYKLKKPVPGKGGLFLVIGMGGISTFIWGVLLGGWLGLDIPEGSFLDKLTWFNPLEEPMMMLGLSMVMGFVHIMFALGLKAARLIKEKDFQGALGEVFSWYLIFGGLIVYVLSSMVFKINVLGTVGLAILILGLAVLLIFGGHGKKGVKRVIGGVGKLYDTVNFMSDILSYSRLFGLGLATGVIGMVINKIVEVIIGLIPVAGYVLGAAFFVLGHVMNIAINTLGTYVHNCRLQYIEFFGKFYDGGGKLFTPIGSETKYTYIER